MGKLLLIFDGFDEMAARIDRQQMINNFWELGLDPFRWTVFLGS
jgi:predicted NACHT family NTPase